MLFSKIYNFKVLKNYRCINQRKGLIIQKNKQFYCLTARYFSTDLKKINKLKTKVGLLLLKTNRFLTIKCLNTKLNRSKFLAQKLWFLRLRASEKKNLKELFKKKYIACAQKRFARYEHLPLNYVPYLENKKIYWIKKHLIIDVMSEGFSDKGQKECDKNFNGLNTTYYLILEFQIRNNVILYNVLEKKNNFLKTKSFLYLKTRFLIQKLFSIYAKLNKNRTAFFEHNYFYYYHKKIKFTKKNYKKVWYYNIIMSNILLCIEKLITLSEKK